MDDRPSPVRGLLDDLWRSQQAQQERVERGEDVGEVNLASLLGTWWIDWPLPFWAKWVRWIPGDDGLEPELGGMAVANGCYADRYDKDVPTYIRADDYRMWEPDVAQSYGMADICSVYREAGPEFWDRIGHGWWGPRYWETLGQVHGSPQVDSVKSVARDHRGVIRLCTGMVVNEQPGWRPRGG